MNGSKRSKQCSVCSCKTTSRADIESIKLCAPPQHLLGVGPGIDCNIRFSVSIDIIKVNDGVRTTNAPLLHIDRCIHNNMDFILSPATGCARRFFI